MGEEGAGRPGASGDVTAGRATAVLVVVTLFWGLSFTWMKNWQEAAGECPGGRAVASLTLIALRLTLALGILIAWQPRLVVGATRREYAAGALLGAVFFAGFSLQVWGLAQTTPALSAFLTSLASAWVPLLGWAVLGLSISRLTLLGLGAGLAGTAVFGLGGERWALGPGEYVTVVASVLFAVQILLLDRLGRTLRPAHLTAGFFAVAALLAWLGAFVLTGASGVGAWGRWTWQMLGQPAVMRDLACLTLLPTVLAFHWMNTYQPLVSASRAALVYLLEPVFSAAFSLWWGHDRVTAPLLPGGGLILAGNILVELPRWLRDARRPALRE